MDPLSILSIAAGVAQLISVANTLAKRLAQFIGKAKNLPNYVHDVHEEIEALVGILVEVRNTLNRRARQFPFERNHHAKTHQIIQSCHKSLKALGEELPPPLKKGSGVLICVRRSIEHSFNEERIRQITNRIASYKSILNISLTTLLLPALSETASSHQKIQGQLQKLTELIQSNSLFSRPTNSEELVHSQTHVADSKDDPEIGMLEKEIHDWRQTVDEIATAVEVSSDMSCDTQSVAPYSSVSVDTLPLYDDKFDPEPDLLDEQDSDILARQLKKNQQLVRDFMEKGMFPQASWYQRKGINLMKQLINTEDTITLADTSHKQLPDMEEDLADILLQCDGDKSKQEAMEVLKSLLKGEVARVDRTDKDRRTRLYHKLGNQYFMRGSTGQARRFLNRAFKDRRRIEPMPRKLVEESAELLIKILRQDQAFDEADGINDWICQVLHQDTNIPSSSTSMHTMQENAENIDVTAAYKWCKEDGIDIDDENFRFGECDPISGTTPMHRAIQTENIDVLRNMLSLSYEGDVERRDMSGSTLLHAAAATRNYNICELLLEERFADPKVFDRSGMTPLHRCQSDSGGVQVAKMLFETCPDLLNLTDNYGKTAIYMACEKGNVKMVRFLLAEARANPNLLGPGRRTPLIATIDDVDNTRKKLAIVELLIRHRADPWIKDADGRTAVNAASNIGLAGSEIKGLLNRVPRRASLATI